MKFLYSIYRLFAYPMVLALTLLACIVVIPFSFIHKGATSRIPYIYSKLIFLLIPVRLKVYGKKNIEKGTSYVFVMNHKSALDMFPVFGTFWKDLRWVMKKELGDIPLFGTACVRLGNIPIDRKNPDKAMRTINIAQERIKDGVSLCFFPEGTRYDAGVLGPFKKGAFYFAKDIGVPVVPVSIIGMDKIMPKKSRLFYPGEVKVFIHSPIDSAQYDRKNIEPFSDAARSIIESTLEREYRLLQKEEKND